MPYTRTNTLIIFLAALALICACLLAHQLCRTWREKRFRRTHPLIHFNATAESIYQAMRDEAEALDDEEIIRRARQWFGNNYDLHKGEQ